MSFWLGFIYPVRLLNLKLKGRVPGCVRIVNYIINVNAGNCPLSVCHSSTESIGSPAKVTDKRYDSNVSPPGHRITHTSSLSQTPTQSQALD